MRESWTAELVPDVLDKTGCDALFNHLSGLATGTTREIFFGHITGRKGFEEKLGSALKSEPGITVDFRR